MRFNIKYRAALVFTISVLSWLLSGNAFAFKLNTHVWIAQQVIDDLTNDPDGMLEIPLNGTVQKFKVDPAIRSAILANPKIYRLGNIGPDASPDVIIGQFSIHPGPTAKDNPMGMGTDEWAMALEDYITDIKNRSSMDDIYKYKRNACEQKNYNLDNVWKAIDSVSGNSNSSSDTNNNPWLKQENYNSLLDSLADSVVEDPLPQISTQSAVNPLELAYQKGFLGHMAADTFAHSYVNHYAGDIYWITDTNDNGTYEMEVEKRHAAIESFVDQRLPPLAQGKPYSLVPSNSEIPAEFLAEAFIFNDKVKNQYKNYSLTSYAYVLNRYRAAIRSAATDCIWTATSRFAGQAVMRGLTDGVYAPNEKQIAAINQVLGKINSESGKALAKAQELKNDIDKNVLDLHKKNFSHILSAANEVSKILDKVIALDQDAKQKAEKVGSMIAQNQCNLEKDITEEVCSRWLTRLLLPDICLAKALKIKTPMCAHYAAYNEAISLRQKADDLLIAYIRDNDALLKEKVIQLRDTMTSTMQTTNLAIASVTEIAVALSTSNDPFQAVLTEWDKNITVAASEWVRAHAQVQINSMNLPEAEGQNDTCWKFGQGINDCVFKGGKGLEPLTNWANIYAPGLVGVPSGLTKFFESANETIGQAGQLLRPIKALDPITRQLERQVEKKISRELSGINVTETLIKLTKDEQLMRIYKDAHAIFYMKWSDQDINTMFASHTITSKSLTDYQNFSATLYKEAGVGANNQVDINVFNPLYNAVILAKLSLLDATQLNAIANLIGIKSPTYNYDNLLYSLSRDDVITRQAQLLAQKNCPPLSQGGDGCIQALSVGLKKNFADMPQVWGSKNIMYNAIKSIDGSEQWKDKAEDSALLRGSGSPKVSESQYGFTFGYGLDDKSNNAVKYGKEFNKGFRFWQEDPGSPKSGFYFNQIFKMPLYNVGSVKVMGCGANADKVFVANVSMSSISNFMPQAAVFCGACGTMVIPMGPVGMIKCNLR